MANYKISFKVLWYAQTKEGYPINLRFKVRGSKPKYQNTDLYIQKREQWNTKASQVQKHPEANKMNILLAKKKIELNSQLMNDKLEDQPITPNSHKKKRGIDSFFAYIKEVRGANRKTTNLINNIKEYQGYEPSIHEIDITWLRKYESYLRDKLHYKDNSVNTIFKVLRRVTNQAYMEKHIKEIVIKGSKNSKSVSVAYPMPEPGKTTPEFLVKEERERWMKGLVENEIASPTRRRALLYFMLSCYSGLRHSDLRKFDPDKHVIGDMIVLRASKTGELICYPIGESLTKIIALIRVVGKLRMEYGLYNSELKEIAKQFETNKNITTHVGRHSFGRLMAELGVSIQDCAYYMGIGVKVCEIYYHTSGNFITDRNKHLRAA